MIHIREELPPKQFLVQVANHCPTAVSTYIYLWDKKDENNCVSISKSDISYFAHPNAFKSNLRKLNIEGLISYIENFGKIFVEMIDWNDLDE